MENINELRQTTQQILAKLAEMEERAKTIDPSSPEGRELALAAFRLINSMPDEDI